VMVMFFFGVGSLLIVVMHMSMGTGMF